MTKHFEREVDKLKKRLYSLCALVEESVRLAVRAIEERDADLAAKVIDGDYNIDLLEVDVEEECLKLLALHQPVAADLRFIVAVLKINNDLERIADFASNIAERANFLASRSPLNVSFDYGTMGRLSQEMLRDALTALIDANTTLARAVCAADDKVDALNREMYQQIQQHIPAHLDRVEELIHLLSVSRHIERIADLATNIAEDVIYMVDGEIVRHQSENYVEEAETND